LIVLKHQLEKGIKRAIWFTEQDIELLQMIWDFKNLSLYQIKYFCERLYGIKQSSIEKKLERWRDGDIVISREYTKPPAAKVYYRIGDEGITVLEKIGKIKKGEKVFLDDLVNKRNYDHYFAVRDVALLSLIKLKRDSKDVTSFSPSEIAYYEKGMEGISPMVVPDWVLSNQYGFLNIELDTGTENLPKLNDKITRYFKYACQRSNEIHHVLLVVLDENDQALKYITNIPRDRSGRIANLKDAIINLNAHIYPNLNFYVVPMSRVGEIAYKIMTGEYPSSADKRSVEINAVISLLELNDKVTFEIESVSENDFYLAEVKETLYADGHYNFKEVENQKSENILIKLMEAGSVKSLDEISYLNLLKSENRFKRKVDKILAVYRNYDELQSDVLGKVFHYVHFTSLDHLKRDLDNPPTFYQTVNTTRKEEVLLYER
jgi:DNA-binding PadR family transcriptional regulator